MRAGVLIMLGAFIIALAGCDPKKPSEPKPPTPKVDLTQVDFTHERSTS